MSHYSNVQEEIQDFEIKMLSVGLVELAKLMSLLDDGQRKKLDVIMSGKKMDYEGIMKCVRLCVPSVRSNLEKVENTFFSIR